MRIAAVIVIAAAAIMPAAAKNTAADSAKDASKESAVEDVFRAFDLFGNWAPDCGKEASPTNPHVSTTAPSAGLVFENHDVGPGYATNRYSVLSAERIGADRVEVKVIFMPGLQGEERQTLVLVIRDGTRRTMFNRIDRGPIRVRHGIALTSGLKTPLLRKCE